MSNVCLSGLLRMAPDQELTQWWNPREDIFFLFETSKVSLLCPPWRLLRSTYLLKVALTYTPSLKGSFLPPRVLRHFMGSVGAIHWRKGLCQGRVYLEFLSQFLYAGCCKCLNLLAQIKSRYRQQFGFWNPCRTNRSHDSDPINPAFFWSHIPPTKMKAVSFKKH